MPYTATQNRATPTPATPTFGVLLKSLRKAAGMTQRDLAAALGYSDSQISGLEKDQRPPDLDAVMQRFAPALGLQDEPATIARLIEQAFAARGERPPAALIVQHTRSMAIETGQEERNKPLPSPPTALIGRSSAVNQLCNRLLGHTGRLLTLVGPPGIGKTTLALAVAAHLQANYADGVVFVALAAISDPTVMIAAILRAVGSHDFSPKPPQTKLIEFLRRKTMLLVLDNLEQLLSPPLPGEGSGVGLVAALVAECPGLSLLATSRERLHLRAEQRFKVPSLDLASAVELFVQRAQAVDADFSNTPQHQPTIAAICQRLDCLPLALELCAAQVDLLSPTQLLAQLQAHRLDLLVDGAHDLPPRQRTLRIAIDHSYQLLTETERSLLRSLGVFVGGFALAELAAIRAWLQAPDAPSLLTTLHALIGKSLVHTETLPTGEQRFLLLETIGEFALEQARTVEEEEALLRQRHYTAYLHLFRTADSHLRGPDVTMWFTRLEREQDNLRAALSWSFAEKRYEDAAWLVLAANWFWDHHGQSDEAIRWLAQLLPHRQALAADLHLGILIIFHAHAQSVEAFQPIVRYRDELIGLLETSPHPLLQVAGWVFMAVYATDFSQSTTAWARAIALARTAGDLPTLGLEFGLLADRDFMLGVTLSFYATKLCGRGELLPAAALATESVQFLQARGNRYERAGGLGTLGHVALLRGELTEAHTFLRKAVQIAKEVHSADMVSALQPLLALVTLYRGNGAEARQLLTESRQISLELKNKTSLAHICIYLTETALWEGSIDEAEQWLVQGLGYYAAPHWITIDEVGRLWGAARLATARQQFQHAATLFGLAEQMHGQVHYAIAGPMRALADAALATVQAALEPAAFAEAFAAGQQLSIGEAFATVLVVAQSPVSAR